MADPQLLDLDPDDQADDGERDDADDRDPFGHLPRTGTVYVYTLDPEATWGREQAFVASYPAPFDLDAFRQEYGGGSWRVQVRDEQGRVRGKRFSVAGPSKLRALVDKVQPGAGRPAGRGFFAGLEAHASEQLAAERAAAEPRHDAVAEQVAALAAQVAELAKRLDQPREPSESITNRVMEAALARLTAEQEGGSLGGTLKELLAATSILDKLQAARQPAKDDDGDGMGSQVLGILGKLVEGLGQGQPAVQAAAAAGVHGPPAVAAPQRPQEAPGAGAPQDTGRAAATQQGAGQAAAEAAAAALQADPGLALLVRTLAEGIAATTAAGGAPDDELAVKAASVAELVLPDAALTELVEAEEAEALAELRELLASWRPPIPGLDSPAADAFLGRALAELVDDGEPDHAARAQDFGLSEPDAGDVIRGGSAERPPRDAAPERESV